MKGDYITDVKKDQYKLCTIKILAQINVHSYM